jgi:DNA-binding HxlR family transcriptional regulator
MGASGYPGKIENRSGPTINAIDIDLTRDALSSSTLNRGLKVLGDQWTVSVLLGAFLGLRRFDDWQKQLEIPRQTLSQRLKTLVKMGVLRQRPYQDRPVRLGYHLTQHGLALYGPILMIWAWERRWGFRKGALPQKLIHRTCGHSFIPYMACGHCGGRTGPNDLTFTLAANPALIPEAQVGARSARMSPEMQLMGLGLRVDRWALLIISAVYLGCHHFDQLTQVLQIGPSVLTRRLGSLVQDGLLLSQPDLLDGRRTVYRLTPSSRDLFPYVIGFAHWADQHFQQPSSIRPGHKTCGMPFVPKVNCSACNTEVSPHDVTYV